MECRSDSAPTSHRFDATFHSTDATSQSFLAREQRLFVRPQIAFARAQNGFARLHLLHEKSHPGFDRSHRIDEMPQRIGPKARMPDATSGRSARRADDTADHRHSFPGVLGEADGIHESGVPLQGVFDATAHFGALPSHRRASAGIRATRFGVPGTRIAALHDLRHARVHRDAAMIADTFGCPMRCRHEQSGFHAQTVRWRCHAGDGDARGGVDIDGSIAGGRY